MTFISTSEFDVWMESYKAWIKSFGEQIDAAGDINKRLMHASAAALRDMPAEKADEVLAGLAPDYVAELRKLMAEEKQHGQY